MTAANPVKGEVTLKAGDEEYTLLFGSNAMAALEEKLDMGMQSIAALFSQDIRIGTLRSMLWAALSEHHDLNEREVGTLMDKAGVEAVGVAIGEAFTLALPKGDAKGKAGPRKPAAKAAGTGRGR